MSHSLSPSNSLTPKNTPLHNPQYNPPFWSVDYGLYGGVKSLALRAQDLGFLGPNISWNNRLWGSYELPVLDDSFTLEVQAGLNLL